MCKDGSEFRPKAVNIHINWNSKWKKFKKRPKIFKNPEEMKTLFAIDCSGSISNQGIKNIYFNKLQNITLNI